MKKLRALLPILLILPTALMARVEPREGEEAIAPEPSVTIVHDNHQVMHVHEINGDVYGIRVHPKNGKPYNLIDTNGDGNFIRNNAEKILVPEWILLKW
ncbi:MAG: DUF2782 domain-containing protein [Pseudomonadales bacterium]|nr:DUF2782 domain-containing protein [Pseudomonadales bacterium]